MRLMRLIRRAGRTGAVLAGAVLLAVSGCGGSSAPATPRPEVTANPADAAEAAGAAQVPAVSGAALQWYGYHRDGGRTGYDPSVPRVGQLRRAWQTRLDGQVYGQPLVLGRVVVAATENDSVYAVDLGSGRVLWRRHLGTPVAGSSLPCGNIDPLGITGTPVYDPATRRVFVVTTTRAGGRVRHVLYGLETGHGRVQVHRPVDPPGVATDVLNQRGALTVVKGVVYVPYGGLYGDCGPYRGTVVGVPANGVGNALLFRVPTPREGGIWAAPGLAVDAGGNLYAAVGNGAVGGNGGGYDGSDSVTKLSPSLRRLDLFAPSGWRGENDTDADLGSSGPLLVGPFVWIQGKTGTGYLLRQNALGGVGGALRTVRGACESQFGGAAAHGLVIYAACTDGVRQIVVSSTGTVRLGWKARSAVHGSPVVGGGAVWALAQDDGTLHALDERTGRDLGSVRVGGVTRFATPALAGSLAVVGTTSGLTAVAGA
jgi:outer membrane protein assembly factor BamB